MVKFTKSKLAFIVVIIIGIMTSFISSNEDLANDELNQGNVFVQAGEEILKYLGYENKENLTKDEMKSLLEAFYIRGDSNDELVINFYRKMINNIYSDLPETIKKSDIKNYFEMSYILRYIGDGLGDIPEIDPDEDDKNDL